ncbi:hypothetical protein WG66_009226 [Moniliophthora roreri]|nr:hypothetical protein WG66_009226 [Moniliophthora roreri]
MGNHVSRLAIIHIPSTVQSLFYGMIHANFVLYILIRTAHGGAFIVSFGICTNILLKRRKGHYQYHLLATAILFILVSANFLVDMILDVALFCFYSSPDDGYDRCWEPTTRFFDASYETALASSLVSDAILLWRCYVVWGKRRRIVILPAFLYVAAHVVGLVLASSDVVVMGNWFGYDEKIPLSPSIVVAISAGVVGLNNLLLSSLIAFRIFRISCEVVAYLGSRSKSMYRTIIAVTLESGLLYSAFLNVLFIIVMGLVSTTIIIRITLSSDNMESTVGLSRATNIENNAAAVIDISRSATGLKQEEASE